MDDEIHEYESDIHPNPENKNDIWLYRQDDLFKRAENIVRALGFRGSVKGYEYTVYQILKTYEDFDNEKET